MNCCAAADNFFSTTHAKRDLRRYRRFGPLPTTRKILRALGDIHNRSFIDVGAGVGAVTHGALLLGAKRVTVVDASHAYLQSLLKEARRQKHADRINTHHGDFVEIASTLSEADIVTMDRVICCYENVASLLDQACTRATWRICMSFPRRAWWSRGAITAFNLVQRVRQHEFRVYYHDPDYVDQSLADNGFVPVQSDKSVLWSVRLYERQ